jgi:hypothetical protein
VRPEVILKLLSYIFMAEKRKIRPSDIPPLANAFSGAIGGAIANLAVSFS